MRRVCYQDTTDIKLEENWGDEIYRHEYMDDQMGNPSHNNDPEESTEDMLYDAFLYLRCSYGNHLGTINTR